jgi:hypothetical protein
VNGAANCPECGSRMTIKDTNHGGGLTFRIAECDCGERWELEERRARRLRPCTAVRSGDPPPTVATPSEQSGGVGGGVSSGSDPVRNSGPISTLPDQDQTRARRKRKATRDIYPAEFEAEWDMTTKAGSKGLACQVWEDEGRPQFGVSWKRWEACAEWRQDWYHPPHVVKWLRDGRYKQDPSETRVKQSQPVNSMPVKPWVAAEKAAEAKKREDHNAEVRARREIQQEINAALAAGGVK